MAVTGASPLTFVSEDSSPGVQYQIALSAISVSGGVATTAWTPPKPAKFGANDKLVVTQLLAGALAAGLIS